MELIEKIIQQAAAYLNPQGQLWLEHEPEQTEDINNLARQNHFTCSTYKDQFKVERYSILMLE